MCTTEPFPAWQITHQRANGGVMFFGVHAPDMPAARSIAYKKILSILNDPYNPRLTPTVIAIPSHIGRHRKARR